METKKIEIHTDGSCLGNPGPGGWAAIIHYNGTEISLSGGEKDTTNNRMEMTAIYKSLEWLHQKSGLSPEELTKSEIIVYSDSNLIMQTLCKGWKRKKNTDIWEKIDLTRAWLNIKWQWVKGHATNKYNNAADKLAVKEAEKAKRQTQIARNK